MKISQEEIFQQVEKLEKTLQETAAEKAADILIHLHDSISPGSGRIIREIIQRNKFPEVVKIYNKALAERAEREAEQAFLEKWNNNIEEIYKQANHYNEEAEAIRQIIPAFKELDGKILSVKIERTLQKYNNGKFTYEYIKYDEHIEVRAYYTKCKNYCVLYINKTRSDFLYDNNRLNGEAIINHLTRTADEHDQDAAEARKAALTLIDKIREFNNYLKKAEAIQKEIQKNTIVRHNTFDFFQYKRY